MGCLPNLPNHRTRSRPTGFRDCRGAPEACEIVRVGVDGLSFIHPSAWKDIYGHGHADLTKCFSPKTTNPNQIIAAESGDRFRLCRAFLPVFSEKVLANQEPLMRVYIDLLIQQLSECAQSSEPAI
jgi:hypothetical protein